MAIPLLTEGVCPWCEKTKHTISVSSLKIRLIFSSDGNVEIDRLEYVISIFNDVRMYINEELN